MIPPTTIVDLSGPARFKAVRIIDGTVYGQRKDHPRGEDTSDPDIVSLATVGDIVEVRPNRRWQVGEYTAVKNTTCMGCGGARRYRALIHFTPQPIDNGE